MTLNAPKIEPKLSISIHSRLCQQILDNVYGTQCEEKEEEASVNLLVLKEQKAVLTFPRLL